MGTDTPVTFRAHKLRLKSVLAHMLRELDLEHTVRGGALVISTPEALESDLITKTYPVDDLLDDRRSVGELDFESLSQGIMSTINSTTWDEVGGEGSIVELGRMLSIKQTFAGHQKIESFLAALRKAHALSKALASGDRAAAAVTADDIDDAAICAALNKPLKFQAIETPLGDVAETLRACLRRQYSDRRPRPRRGRRRQRRAGDA